MKSKGKNPKYSLIIPTRNALVYVMDCIHSVLGQDFDNYELIVSDNHSSDGSFDAVAAISSEHLRLIRPPDYMAMVDHWEWALSHAQGEWVIFLGSDDGVMPYFFRLAESLTSLANRHDIPIIGSRRSYFFWPGCQNAYGNLAIQYRAIPACHIRNTKLAILDALVGTRHYLELPQMYTNSLVHRSLIARAKEKQNGIFFSAQTPDACGAAVICSLADRYLESLIPLGWVGTSPKSNGMAYTDNKDKYQTAYFKNMLPRTIRWNETMGKFNPVDGDKTVDNMRAFFFEAILQAHAVIDDHHNRLYNSAFFKALLFSRILYEIRRHKTDKKHQWQCLRDIMVINRIPLIAVLSLYPLSFVMQAGQIIRAIKNRLWGTRGLTYRRPYNQGETMTLLEASAIIESQEKSNDFIASAIRSFTSL